MRNRCPRCDTVEGTGTGLSHITCEDCLTKSVEAEEVRMTKKEVEAKKVKVAGRKSIPQRLKLWRADIADPVDWKTVAFDEDGLYWARALENKKKTGSVIITEQPEDDGYLWAHFSIAKIKGHICYQDLKWLMKNLVGPDWPAMQLMPPRTSM